MQLTEGPYLVLGAGASGRAVARFLLSRGAAVDLYDDAPASALPAASRELTDAGARLLAGGPQLTAERYRLAVVSPGISAADPRVALLRAAGVEVVGEVELASRLLAAPLVAVTGTNGKTTVTEMIGCALRAAGRKVFVGGNLGTPLIEAVGPSWDALVVEVSSYQLETIEHFHARVAVLLNVSDDHLQRHGNRAGYQGAKARVFNRQGPADTAVVNADDPLAWQAGQTSRATLLPFSLRGPLACGAWIEGDQAVFLMPGQSGLRLPLGDGALRGDHNLANALAAGLAAARAGCSVASSWAAVRAMPGLPHRLEHFLEHAGATYVDDSKATNVDAAVKALEAVTGPVLWLAGGVDKGGDYGPLRGPVGDKVRHAVLAGPAAALLEQALAGCTTLEVAADWEEAATRVLDLARPGDTVLLAPACASFDAFTDFTARGRFFQSRCRRAAEAGGAP